MQVEIKRLVKLTIKETLIDTFKLALQQLKIDS